MDRYEPFATGQVNGARIPQQIDSAHLLAVIAPLRTELDDDWPAPRSLQQCPKRVVAVGAHEVGGRAARLESRARGGIRFHASWRHRARSMRA